MTRTQLIAIAVALLSCAAVARAQTAGGGGGDGTVMGPAPLQCTAAMLLKCRYVALNACGATEWPAPQSDNNCCPNFPSCRLPQACNETVVRACDIDEMAVCPLDANGAPTAPARTADTSCCPTCRRAPPRGDRCTTDPSQIPRCAPGTVPSIVSSTGCLSCRPEDGRVGNCTLSSLQQCAQTFASLPSCDGDDIQRNNQDNSNPLAPPSPRPCCLNCRPNYLQYCNATTIAQCHRNHDQLPVCGNGVRASFNKPSCCRACRRQLPDVSNRPDANGICTFAKLRTCFQNAPICADGERPFVANSTFCCPECRRAERACSIEDVVRCRTQQPDCAAGELPSHVDGECCATCKPVKAACTCNADTEVCVYQRDVTVTPTCAPKLTVSFTLAPAASNSDALSVASALQIAHLLREMVARYCDHNANDGRCQRRATQLRNSDFSYVANADGSWTVTVTYPDVADDAAQDGGASAPTQARAGQVLTVSTSADAGIYFAAASDAESGDGYTASDSSDASPRAAAGFSVALAVAVAYAMTF